MNAWRLLPLESLDPSVNMAVDEALLRLHAEGEAPPTVRFYQWSPPAVSLGRFQRLNAFDLGACRRLGLTVVRRSTGGRAVLHQGDLTYSVVAGTADGVPPPVAASYDLVSRGLAEGLRLLGVEVEPGREATKAAGPAVCFLRSAAGDLTHRGRKFVGSAQSWRGESMLQHGSVLLKSQTDLWVELLGPAASTSSLRARLASRTTSLGEVLGRTVEPDEVARALAQGLERVLKVRLEPGALTAEERALAREFAAAEFTSLNRTDGAAVDNDGGPRLGFPL
ncbi:MAG: lipoate--protein ligase family protein [Deltaproteobacteria bacterium]|nr:lipoate--protein ligase family protein [Deltaproteobacteria bacterium]